MNNLFKLSIVTICVLSSSLSVFSQELEIDTTAVTPTKCLASYRHFISVNTLQFATGTANINYECNIVPMFSLKVGVGTVLGTRILFNEAQLPCIPGGIYAMVEPRLYFKKSSEACMIQYGLSAAYKYWDFVGENVLASFTKNDKKNMSAYTYDGQPLSYYENDDKYNVTSEGIYEKEDMVEHLGNISFFGKGCIAGGLTAEIEAGVGFGVKAEKFYFTPNLGISFGWTFGKKKSAE